MDQKTKQIDFKSRKYFYFQLAFYTLCVVINFVLSRTAGALGLPLYLDNIGTLLASILGGYLPGIFVGYLNNIINMQGNPGNAYYVVLSTMIAASGAWLGQKGWFDKFWKALCTIPIFAFIGGALGSILTYLLYGFGMGEGISAPFARTLLESGKLSVFWAQFISDVTLDLIDKGITVVAVYVILKLIPDYLKPGLWLTGWRQAPMSKEALADAKKNNTRSFSLRGKIITIISVIMFCVAVVTTIISYILYQNFAKEQYTYTCRSAAALTVDMLDPDRIDEYLKMNEFTVYIVSGSDRFIVRGLIEDGGLIDLPMRQLIGSDQSVAGSGQNDTDGLEYQFTDTDETILGGDFLVKNLKMNKVSVSVQEIGVQPVLSFGNTSGDQSMAEYAISNNPYKSLAFMVCCDDLEREYGDLKKAGEMQDLCKQYGWTPISMKNDWKTIYGENVVKTSDTKPIPFPIENLDDEAKLPDAA